MQNSEEVKDAVREKYARLALLDQPTSPDNCCGSGTSNIMSDSYTELQGYNEEADLGLGCGLPTEFARIQKGDTVLDLGSGAGNDCFVARAETGETGHVIGVDFTPAMIERARANAEKLGYANVEFREGDIEDLPIADNSVDVVVSNCVLNLVPDKARVFAEIMRVLKPGGHFSISDIVVSGSLPEGLQETAEEYVGCVVGAIDRDAYLGLIRQAGFKDVAIQKQKVIALPEEVISADTWQNYADAGNGIFSITVFGRKV